MISHSSEIPASFAEREQPLFSWKSLISEMAQAAEYQPAWLLIGETGTGKSYLAQQLHQSSPRKTRLYQEWLPEEGADNSSAPAEWFSLLQTSLNPHIEKTAGEPASAAGSLDQKPSPLGTLLIHEVESLSPRDQWLLCEWIERFPQGRIPADIPRVILACPVDPREAVEAGRLREDLYYRLSMYQFEIPPLRQRPTELGTLTRLFVKWASERFQRRIDRIEEAFLRLLKGYNWPGNVRELKHVIERAVLSCHSGVLAAEHLPATISNQTTITIMATKKSTTATEGADVDQDSWVGASREARADRGFATRFQEESLEQQVALTEREMIEESLSRNHQCRTRTARELGISRVTLYNKMKKLGLETRKALS